MDLIYTDADKIEQGVLQDYSLDIDIADTKDFEIVVNADNNVMYYGSVWYIEGTEFFGIVKGVDSDTNEEKIIYTGENARGVLYSKVIIPPKGTGYRIVSGSFKEIIAALISEHGLENFFQADEECDLEIPIYKFDRYCTLYDGVVKMLAEYDYNIVLTCKGGFVRVGATIKNDYSDYLQYETDNTLMFKIENNNNGVNHLVCLGSGEMENRHVIHLFTDENGGIRPYALKDNPLQDSDYILDESQKMIFGIDENADVLNYPNADTVSNYILLEDIPADWFYNYKSYFFKEGSEYKNVDGVTTSSYNLIASEPADWVNTYGNYFTIEGGAYQAVKGIDIEIYTILGSHPPDWLSNYDSYYEYWSDGTSSKYNTVQGVSYDKYELQTMQPSDWKTDFDKYYKKKTVKKKTSYVTVDTDLSFKVKTKENNVKIYKEANTSSSVVKTVKSKGTTYTVSKISGSYGYISSVKGWIQFSKVTRYKPTAPKWAKGKYYTKKTYYKAPEWKANKYYVKQIQKDVAPAFAVNTYYSRTDVEAAPIWYRNSFYKCVLDHYAELVSSGINYLKENCNSRTAQMSITELDCTIGDIVGGKDYISGIELYEEITNIIAKVTDGEVDLEYKIGDGKNGI